jgi:hypothetical protein
MQDGTGDLRWRERADRNRQHSRQADARCHKRNLESQPTRESERLCIGADNAARAAQWSETEKVIDPQRPPEKEIAGIGGMKKSPTRPEKCEPDRDKRVKQQQNVPTKA